MKRLIRHKTRPFLNLFLILSIAFTLWILVFQTLVNPPKVKAHLYIGYSVLDHLIPIPGGRKFPCDDILDPEFHSLRPYQASPCGDSAKTWFCWNDYRIVEPVSRRWGPDCVQQGNYYSCPNPNPPEIEKIYTVDGEYARFPIMGNTEQVFNSQYLIQ